jgi:hypothetical protein
MRFDILQEESFITDQDLTIGIGGIESKREIKETETTIEARYGKQWRTIRSSANFKNTGSLSADKPQGCIAQIKLAANESNRDDSMDVQAQDNLISAEFDGETHAEINGVLEVSKKSGVELNKESLKVIDSIKISSPPCPRCAVVLQNLGLSDKVEHTPGTSKTGPTWGWPADKSDELFKILNDGIPENDQAPASKRDDVIRYFKSGDWAT